MKNLLLLSFYFISSSLLCVAQSLKLVLPIGHTKTLVSAQFSPDGKKIITASRDNTAKVWDAYSGTLLTDLNGHYGGVNYAEFSHDGKKMITCTWGTAKVWDARNGKLLCILKGHTSEVISAQFSPDDQKIVTASFDHTAKVWNTESGDLLVNLKGHSDQVNSASFSPDGKKIITSADDSLVKIWSTATGELLNNLRGHSYKVIGATFSPDGKKVVTASKDYTAKIWDAVSGKLLISLAEAGGWINTAVFSPDGKKVVTASNDNTGKVWDAETGNLISNLAGHTSWVIMASFSTDGKKIVTASKDQTARIWDANNGDMLTELDGHSYSLASAMFSPDGKKVVTASIWPDKIAKIWDASTAEELAHLTGYTTDINYVQYRHDGKRIAVTSWDYGKKIWNAETGSPVSESYGEYSSWVSMSDTTPDGKRKVSAYSIDSSIYIWDAASENRLFKFYTGSEVTTASYSPDGKKIVSVAKNDTVQIWDADSGKLLATMAGHTSTVNSAQFSRDGNRLVTSSFDGSGRIWDVHTGKMLAQLLGHASSVSSAQFSPDGKKIVTVSTDNTAIIWDSQTGKEIYRFFAVGNGGYINLLSSGYYQSTPVAAKLLHYVTDDLRVVSFEQLDIKYNRPDKVLIEIGNRDTTLIRAYQKAYEKRIRKLGIDTTFFRDGVSVPEAEIINREQISSEQEGKTVRIEFRSKDSIYNLAHFNVWVNEIPVYGQRGISLRKRATNFFDTIITIKLSAGKNRIEASVSNINGIESYRTPLFIKYKPVAQQKEKTRFIGIGIEKFRNSKYNLQYSVKDIRDLSKKLKKLFGKDISIDTLFNENVTVENIKALKNKLLNSTEDDKVIIAYSGHGLLSRDFDYYLSTYSINFDKPEQNGLPYDILENLLDSIPARKKLMLIDACHSGEVDKEDLVTLDRTPKALIKGLKPVAYKKEGQLGLKNSFELMQELFINVGKSTGATIISAAGGTQFALERGDLKNGVFTYCLLEAMEENTTMKISELKNIIGERVERITNGLQKPTSRNENITVDWSIW